MKKILVGEALRNYNLWKSEGMPYAKLILKRKEYARTKTLDGDASRGKQAVNVGRVDTSDNSKAETGDDETVEDLSAVPGVKCYLCRQAKCTKTGKKEAGEHDRTHVKANRSFSERVFYNDRSIFIYKNE